MKPATRRSKTPWKTQIGKALARERKRQGLSLHELADRSGLTHSAIARLEAGRDNFTIDTLERVAVALHMRMNMSSG